MEGLINIHNTFHHIDWLNQVFKFITMLGDVGFVWLFIAFILFFFKRTRKCSIVLVVSLAFGHIFNNIILKMIFGRNRPFIVNDDFKNFILNLKMDFPEGSSFPSGHAFSSFLCATILTLFNKKVGFIVFFLATIISLSRIYLCVHYPTDVLCGAVLGILFACLCYYFYKLVLKKIEKIRRDKVKNEKI